MLSRLLASSKNEFNTSKMHPHKILNTRKSREAYKRCWDKYNKNSSDEMIGCMNSSPYTTVYQQYRGKYPTHEGTQDYIWHMNSYNRSPKTMHKMYKSIPTSIEGGIPPKEGTQSHISRIY